MITSNYCCEMEDEVKLFIAGARKIAGIKGFSQEDIYRGMKWPTGLTGSQGTISSYFVGRTRPKKETMYAIADFLGVSFEEALTLGRQTLTPPQPDTAQIEQIAERVFDKKMQSDKKIHDYQDKYRALHHAKVDEFPEQKKALEMNSLAVDLCKINPREIDEVIDFIKFRLSKNKGSEPIQPPAEAQGER